MKSAYFYRKLTAGLKIFSGLFMLAAFSAAVAAQEDSKNKVQSRQVRQIVNRINRIEELPIKKGEPVSDKYAKAIVELGASAAPYLIEKLTDRRKSRVAYLFEYKIGDVARSLLDIIYNYPDYPFPDGSKSLPSKYGNYQDYVEFFGKSQNRKQLQKSWQNYIKNRTVSEDAQ